MKNYLLFVMALIVIGTAWLTACSSNDKHSKTAIGGTLSKTDGGNTVVSPPIINGSFAIHNVKTGKNIRPYNAGISDGNDIILYPHHEWKCMTWQFHHIDGTAYQLQNLYTQKTFEPMSILELGVALWQQPLNTNSPQWEFIKQQEEIYLIKLKGTELYITISSDKTNSPIILMPYENSNNQQWVLLEQYPAV
jgi:hypothetical protein